MKIIAGLGNPGKRYVNTRHNVGYKVVELVAQEYGTKFFPYLNNLVEIAKINIYNQLVLIAKPLTFMNNSGLALTKLIKAKHVSLDQFLVVYDDIDIPIGGIKVKAFGGSGGHKGIDSIIQYLESKNFPRVKLGIGHPGRPELVKKYVLSEIKNKKELAMIRKSIIMAKEAIKVWIKFGIKEVMSRFN